MKEKTKIIIVVFITFFFLVFFLWLAYQDSQANKQKIKPIPTIIPTPTIDINSGDTTNLNTGAIKTELSSDEQKMFNEMKDLYKKIPIETALFKMSFDYKSAKFLVVFSENIIDKDEVLENWLIENNYSNVLMENFIIK